MKADPRFLNQPKSFWANVRTISQANGYADRGGQVKVHTLKDISKGLGKAGLVTDHVLTDGQPTALGQQLVKYFEHRAAVLNLYVRPRLMDVAEAKVLYEKLYSECKPRCPIPKNKQKGDKSGPAYLTAVVNMLLERHSGGLPVDYDPKQLTTMTYNGAPLRTLSRRVDGAFPGPVDPIAIWEIKEYYHTTSFGSRIADGVYETQLDGMELEELWASEQRRVHHLLIADSHRTWWGKGRSYLCRIVDMLHMGLVTEVLFGSEVVEQLPRIVAEWVQQYKSGLA
ncbi:MAG TPA: hypothetical protein VEX86_02535 [Longimicrobium sp.]|nr:hypothetical protein [Longimicrobium sp.]